MRTLRIERGERVCVVGRNGAGKSTLLRIISGEQPPDAGSVWTEPGLRIARLDQDVPISTDRTVFDVVADALGDLSDLVARYHHTARSTRGGEHSSSAREARDACSTNSSRPTDGASSSGSSSCCRASTCQPMPASTRCPADGGGGCSSRGRWSREPDVLLLDEPTNHLDLDAIIWLETFLAEYPGALVFVTHDRAFLQRVATRIVEIDRGRLTSWPGDYATFLRKKDEWLANEAITQDKFDKRLAEEEAWLRQGVKARRTRNEGRVRALMAMREERAARRELAGHGPSADRDGADASGQLVFEADAVTQGRIGSKPVVRDFSARIMRGDRIGLIGPNGAGKTTLLRLLLGELAPDQGEVRRGANVEVAYYDQQREQLDPERTVFDTVGDGNDTVTVDGRSRHVNAYLRDFLFPAERAQSPVKALSGGERNRLLLARLFTRPANLLVLDEPTNDLDLETLELLEAQLVEWPGTLLLVSHDRAFLDNVVTSTFVFEGGGRVEEYVGGYEDWLRQRAPLAAAPDVSPVQRMQPPPRVSTQPKKLSFNERRELDELPARIEALEAEQRALGTTIADPGFYRQPAAAITAALERTQAIEHELGDLYARWDTLDSRSP